MRRCPPRPCCRVLAHGAVHTSSVIRPSRGCHARSGRVRPSRVERVDRLLPEVEPTRRGPTTKDSSSRTGPSGSTAAPETAAWIASFVGRRSRKKLQWSRRSHQRPWVQELRAAQIRTDDCSSLRFVHHTGHKSTSRRRDASDTRSYPGRWHRAGLVNSVNRRRGAAPTAPDPVRQRSKPPYRRGTLQSDLDLDRQPCSTMASCGRPQLQRAIIRAANQRIGIKIARRTDSPRREPEAQIRRP